MKVGIVGGGHNGLVLASYLAKSGLAVSVFEAREKVGGLCVNEEIFPGHKVATVATYFGMFRSEIISELDLGRFGLSPYLTDPAEIVLLPNGHYVFTPRGGSETTISAGDVSASDMDGWRRFWSDVGAAAAAIAPYYFKPDTRQIDLRDILREKGLSTIADKLFDGSLLELLDCYLNNEYLQAAAATCTPGFASNKGSVFGCIHHGTAETCGITGAWGMVRGGMGAVSEALERCAIENGARLLTRTPVRRIRIEDGKAVGLELEDGRFERFDLIVSNADPLSTFKNLVGREHLSAELNERLVEQPSAVSAGKVHLLLKRLPRFAVLDSLSHNYAGIIVVAPSVENVRADAVRVAQYEMPGKLMMTMSIPTISDETLAPPDRHHMNIDVHYLPACNRGEPWNEQSKQIILDAVIDNLKVHASDIEEVLDDAFVVSPTDLKRRFGVATSMCWHLPMTGDFAFDKRVLPGCTPYGTPIQNLHLCGAGTFGGGNVTGIAGYNCAKLLLHERLAARI